MIKKDQNDSAKFDLSNFRVEALSKDPDVLNPLRFRRISDKLGSELFPRLSVYTQRAKYFGLVLYWAKNGWTHEGNKDHLLDQLMTCAFLATPGADSTGVVGRQDYERRLNFDSENSIRPAKHRLVISSVDMYSPPLRALDLLSPSGKPTARGEDLLKTLKLPESELFIKAINEFVNNHKPFPRSFLTQLKRWELGEMTPEYKRQLRRIFGMQGTPLEPKTRALGSLLQLLDGFRKKKEPVFKGLLGGQSEQLLSKSSRLDQVLKTEHFWKPGAAGLLREDGCLEVIARYDRLLFFSQTLFELLFLRACRSSKPCITLSQVCHSLPRKFVSKGRNAIDSIRAEMLDLALTIAEHSGHNGPLEISKAEEASLLKLAWKGFVLTRALYPDELEALLSNLGSNLSNRPNRSLWNSQSPVEVFCGLIELHESFTTSRHVTPWITRKDNAIIKEVADNLYRPTIFTVRSVMHGFFGYRIARMAHLVGDLAA